MSSSLQSISKRDLHDLVRNELVSRLEEFQESLRDIKSSSENETKSSAGDKYETGREMMQQEIEKLYNAIDLIKFQLQLLDQKRALTPMDTIDYGAFVVTENMAFYIVAAIGRIPVKDSFVNVISAATPVANQFKGKKKGDIVVLNGKEHTILRVS